MEMQEMIRFCYNRAKNLLLEKRDKLDLLAQTLLVRETLDEQQIRQLLEHGKLDDDVKVNIQGKEEKPVSEARKEENGRDMAEETGEQKETPEVKSGSSFSNGSSPALEEQKEDISFTELSPDSEEKDQDKPIQ
jgi:cell division protease FtsH